jgi:hypothetical protein
MPGIGWPQLWQKRDPAALAAPHRAQYTCDSIPCPVTVPSPFTIPVDAPSLSFDRSAPPYFGLGEVMP